MCIAASIYFYLPVYLRNKGISDLERQGIELAKKVDEYQRKNHKLPEYLEDLKLNLPDDYPLNYNKTKDSGVYVIGFQVRPFRSMVYSSDTKVWLLQ